MLLEDNREPESSFGGLEPLAFYVLNIKKLFLWSKN